MIKHLNYILLHATFYIYDKKKKSLELHVYDFAIWLKNTLSIKQINMCNKNMQKKFDKVWLPLLELL